MRMWVEKVHERFPAATFYAPGESRSPSPGKYVVEGPTSGMAESEIDMEHAAALFLGHFHRDVEALRYAGRRTLERVSKR